MIGIKQFFRRLGPNIRFRLSAMNHPLFLAYYKYIYKPKPNSISAFIDEYSRFLKGNIQVVQIGANDGINHDPISKFIKRDGWTGVLLEPQRIIHDQFLQKVYAKNIGIQTLCAALGPEDGTRILYKIGWCDMRWASGLASFQRETLENAYSSGVVARASKKNGLKMPKDTNQYITTEKVKVVSPSTLIKQYKIAEFSLLQIDTEGYDFEVIKLFDVHTTKPKAIVYENIHLSSEAKITCHKHLYSAGYKVKDYGANTLALHKRVSDKLFCFVEE